MTIYTLNVGQGQFVIVANNREAIIIDTYVPTAADQSTVHVKAALAKVLDGVNLVGLMITGFDADHFNEIGLRIVLNKYRPEWIMYPQYFKPTDNATKCFRAMDELADRNKITRVSVMIKQAQARFYEKLSKEFAIEALSPHPDDMDSSNNCSLVCVVKEKSTGFKYLVTGDTETARWNSIVRFFSESLNIHVLAAPHHGSRNGITDNAMRYMRPHTVLISAGVSNQYGHPHPEAMRIYRDGASVVRCTSENSGTSHVTHCTPFGIMTYPFTP